MTLFPQFELDSKFQDAQAFWRVPIGAASPLWAAYGVMATAGATYWWLSQWTRSANLQAANLQAVNLEAFVQTPQLPVLVEPTAPALVVETLAAIQPEPAALEAEPLIEPAPPEVELVEAAAESAEAAVEVTGEAIGEAVGEAAIVMSLAADDLTRLVGIGPSLAGKLGAMGVKSFDDIAAWTDEDIAKMDKALDLKGRAVRERWVDQARQFAAQ